MRGPLLSKSFPPMDWNLHLLTRFPIFCLLHHAGRGQIHPKKKAAFHNCEERQLMRNAPFPSCNTTLTTFFAREFRLLTSAVGTSLFMQSSMLSLLSKPGNEAEENHEGRSITIHYISSPFSLSGTERLPGRARLPMFSYRFTSGSYCIHYGTFIFS